jgi:hypothetical protein
MSGNRRAKTADQAADLFGLCDKFHRSAFVHVSETAREVKVGTRFTTRRLCDAEEPVKLGSAPALEALRNVRRNRDTGSGDLIAKCKVAGKLSLARDGVDVHCQIHCSLPRDQVLETFDLIHGSSVPRSVRRSKRSTMRGRARNWRDQCAGCATQQPRCLHPFPFTLFLLPIQKPKPTPSRRECERSWPLRAPRRLRGSP